MRTKNIQSKFLTVLFSAAMLVCPISVALNPVIVANAHGGHHNQGHRSNTSSCYYHCGGYPSHLHENGVCPYALPEASTPPATAQNTVQQSALSAGTASTHACGWHQDQVGWWYSENDGQYVRDGKCYINGHCFLFDENGYMQTGWHETEHCWNYYDENGYMACGWKEIDGEWYYFDSVGAMMTGVQCIDDEWYCFEEDGAWDRNYYDANLNRIAR